MTSLCDWLWQFSTWKAYIFFLQCFNQIKKTYDHDGLFSISSMASVRRLDFLKCANVNFLHGLQLQSACSCKNFVLIGWKVAELLQIQYFQYGGRLPSWVHYTHARDHPRGRIGGPKKPWKFRPNRLSNWDTANFSFWSFGWEVPIFTPQFWRFFESATPKSGQLSFRHKKAHSWPERRRLTYRS